MHRIYPTRGALFATVVALNVVAFACARESNAPPTQTVYQNGYPQTQQQAYGNQVTYQNGYPQQGYAQPQPSSPAPNNAVATATTAPTAAPPPAATATETVIGAAPVATQTTLPAPAAPATMAVPGLGAIPCQNDAMCLLGRCNVPYGRCAYPCKSSAVDCAPNAVCGPLGLCVPGQLAPKKTL